MKAYEEYVKQPVEAVFEAYMDAAMRVFDEEIIKDRLVLEDARLLEFENITRVGFVDLVGRMQWRLGI